MPIIVLYSIVLMEIQAYHVESKEVEVLFYNRNRDEYQELVISAKQNTKRQYCRDFNQSFTAEC